jgi:hypothetical protein
MTAQIYSRDVTGRRTIAGLFPDRASAEQAIDELKAGGCFRVVDLLCYTGQGEERYHP